MRISSAMGWGAHAPRVLFWATRPKHSSNAEHHSLRKGGWDRPNDVQTSIPYGFLVCSGRFWTRQCAAAAAVRSQSEYWNVDANGHRFHEES